MQRKIAIAITIAFALTAPQARADQSLAGAWNGALNYPGGPCLPLVLHITGASPNLAATVDEPGVVASPVSSIVVNGNAVLISIDNPQISNVQFKGTLSTGAITGTWIQGRGGLPLTFRPATSSSSGGNPCSVNDLAGTWNGVLYPPGGRPVSVVLHINGAGSNLSATVDTNSGLFGVAVNGIVANGTSFSFFINSFQISDGQYTGTLGDGTIIGTWTQGGNSLPLTFRKAG